MTESEAIKQFKERIDIPDYKEQIAEYYEAMEMAINALEKQIPKKPQNKKYSFYPHSTLLKSKYGECPACKSMQEDDEYCANCGQKLDWSDENE